MDIRREFELSGIDERKAYCKVLKKLENRYTGDIVRYVRTDYSTGDIDFQLLTEEEYEQLLEFMGETPKRKNTQEEMEDFWHDN